MFLNFCSWFLGDIFHLDSTFMKCDKFRQQSRTEKCSCELFPVKLQWICLAKKQKAFPQLGFQLLWYMTLQEVLKNGPGMGFVLVFKAQIIVQGPVTSLTARSERGLWDFAVPRHHQHPSPQSPVSPSALSACGSSSVCDITWHCSCRIAAWGNLVIVRWQSSGQESWGTSLLLSRPSRDESDRPGEVSHVWNEAINPVIKLKWKLWRTGVNDGLLGSQTRQLDRIPVVFHGLLF